MVLSRGSVLLLFVAHLVIRAAAVPHMHDTPHGPTPDHGSRPHIHLGGHGHHHDHEHSDHDSGHHTPAVVQAPTVKGTTGDQIAVTSPCCCHDDDAIDVSMSTPAESSDWRRALTGIEPARLLGLPAVAMVACPQLDGWCGLSSRPPGHHGGTLHDRLPHVLRI
jgi:hypothetical protein